MDEFWKRHLEEAERLRRLMDPLDLKQFQDPGMRAIEEQERLTRLADPLADFGPLDAGAWSDMASSATDRLGEVRDQLTSLSLPRQEAMDRMLGWSETLSKQIEQWLKPVSEARSFVDAWLEQEQVRIRRWSKVFDDFAEQLRRWPEELKRQLTVLLAQGWCLDPDWTPEMANALADAFQQGEEEAAQEWLMDHFTEKLDDIEATLVKRHPKRQAIIAEAFQAHREGRYNLSILAMLSQAEGVIFDRHSQHLFSTVANNNLEMVLHKLPPESMGAIFVGVFYGDNPLIAGKQKLPAGFDGLNRHAVLDGRDVTYGTKLNALRAVSLLNLASHLAVEGPDDVAK